jgi:cell division protein FtsI (penicillin-binding protein 3)
MASWPTFNPNYYAKYAPENYRNRAILSIYEPGSTFKIFTAATALEEHLATPDEKINCMNGSIAIGKRRIRDHKKYGILSVREVVAYSSNVGAIQLGFRIGKERFERYIRNFGFGEPTAVDLPGEASGLIRPASQWLPINLGTISMGHGIGVTPLQLLTAVSAIANGGYLPRPHVVMQFRKGPLQRISYDPDMLPRRVLREDTSHLIKEMLSGVVVSGTGKAAQLEGFSSAGKTGTAQKLDANGRYSHSRFIASFVGFAPIRDPAVAIVVTIDEPRGQYYGGEVAAPVFKNIAEKALRYISVSPDQEVTPQQQAKQRGRRKEALREPEPDQVDLMDIDWEVPPVSGDTVPEAPTPENRVSPEEASYQIDLGDSPGVDVPDFTGRSVRFVLQESIKLGLQLDLQGSGLATKQFPAPHTKVATGSKISVKFSRHLD